MLPSAIVIIAYLLGSIPFGYLVVRGATGGGDVRETGSGGTGATNVTRRAGKKAGILTLVLDALKGTLAVYISLATLTTDWNVTTPVAAAAVAVIAGHIFPVWLRFRGGKGVATGLGAFLVLAPLACALAAFAFLVVFALTRYVSLGSIIAATTIPCLSFFSTRCALTQAG
jgi:glycerol-3-phosphate acyltransferase PlsY